MNIKFLKLISLIVLSFAIFSCESDDPADPVNEMKEEGEAGEQEVITTVKYTLTEKTSGEKVVFSSTDLDGEGGENAVLAADGTLKVGEYDGSFEILNETLEPTDEEYNIAAEILELADEHQMFFILKDTEGITINYADKDSKDRPLGLESTVSITKATTGKLQIVLRHEPAKDAEGVKDGDITNAGGESDFDFTFDIVVE